jgi:hypothetical protein
MARKSESADAAWIEHEHEQEQEQEHEDANGNEGSGEKFFRGKR